MASSLCVSALPAEATDVCDLVQNVSCPVVDGGLFFTDRQRVVATGFVDAFLRIQQKEGRPANSNEKPINGQYYYEFFFDADEPSNGTKNVTLDQLEFYVPRTAGLNNQGEGGDRNGRSGCLGVEGQVCGSQSAKFYSLDDAVGPARDIQDNRARIDYVVSGTSDLVFYLSTQSFIHAAAARSPE